MTKNGAHIMKQQIETRNRLSREKRWKHLDEDVDYRPSDLDRDIVNSGQIRTVMKVSENAFRQVFAAEYMRYGWKLSYGLLHLG